MTDGIQRFFDFARERHSIYLRKKELANREFDVPERLTDDPILGKYRFTNVFRELDATTVWFRENVREKISGPEVLLATVVFRWFNRIETGRSIFSSPWSEQEDAVWDNLASCGDNHRMWLDMMQRQIVHLQDSGPYVTGAYIIKTPDGYNKLDGVLKCIEWFMEQSHQFGPMGSKNWREVADIIITSKSADDTPRLEMVWEWLRQFPYLGDFMAYEIVTDLRWTPLLNDSHDIMTWANPGPGAARGASRIFGANGLYSWKQTEKTKLNNLMRQLLEASQDPQYWPQRAPSGDWFMGGPHQFAYLRDQTGDWPAWEMREVEHTLCEFDKYERARLGEGRPRGVYRQ